jgi:hypothetical protein
MVLHGAGDETFRPAQQLAEPVAVKNEHNSVSDTLSKPTFIVDLWADIAIRLDLDAPVLASSQVEAVGVRTDA